MPDDDVKYTLARIEAKLDVTLPAHSERLNEHSRILEAHDVRLRKVEQDGASAAAGTSESRRLPNWVPIIAAVATLTLAAITIISLLK